MELIVFHSLLHWLRFWLRGHVIDFVRARCTNRGHLANHCWTEPKLQLVATDQTQWRNIFAYGFCKNSGQVCVLKLRVLSLQTPRDPL